MQSFRFVAVFVCFGLLAGCKKQLNPQTIQLLGMASTIAKERVESFKVIRGHITAKDPAEVEATEVYLTAHQEGLQAQANALANLVRSVELNNGKLSKNLRSQIKASVDTAKARADNFLAAKERMKAKEAADKERIRQWMETHADALVEQIRTLGLFAIGVEDDHAK